MNTTQAKTIRYFRIKFILLFILLFSVKTALSADPLTNESFSRAAQETGGQVFLLDNTTAENSEALQAILGASLSGDQQTILLVRDTITGLPGKTFSVPVDSTSTSITISINVLNDAFVLVNLLRPNGDSVFEIDPDTTITALSDTTGAQIISIKSPDTGIWRLELRVESEIDSEVSVSAKANSPLEFYRFDFVKPNQDIHGGFFPISGQPASGATTTGKATLLGPFANSMFKLVDERGHILQDIGLEQNFPNADADQFLGIFNPPPIPFRVMAIGHDNNGVPYQRMLPILYQTQSVIVQADISDDTVPTGKTSKLDFKVANVGNSATFSINADDTRGFITAVIPKTLDLGADASGVFQIDVTVPADTPLNTDISITAIATSTTDTAVQNSAIVDLITANPSDLDGDGDVDRDDLNIILAARDMPASGPDDPRDLDGDGMITALDARKLTLLCTRRRCATE